MPQCRLLHAEASGLSAWLWHAGALRDEGRFAADAEGHAAFAAYLLRHRSSVFHLLADFAEEGFQYEVIPFVRGGDRTALVHRKLNQFFYGSTLATALSLGRETGGRRDERVLFAALTRPQMLDPWLTAMHAAETQLAGVYSAPLLAPSLAKRIKIGAPRCLLVSVGRAGIRQTFLEDGKLRFSRLSPLTAGAAGETARACAAETARLYQYLAGQRVVIQTTPLPVLILAERSHHAAFQATCASSEELDYHFIDLAATQRQCGLKQPADAASGDLLFLHLLAQQPPAQQFAPAVDRHFYRLGRTRLALTSAGALALMGCLLFAARDLYDVHVAHVETLGLADQAQVDAQRYADILNGLPPMPTSLNNLRAVVTRYKGMEARTASPDAMMLQISRALDASPQIEIERIEWETTAHPDDPTQDLRRMGTSQAQPPTGLYAVATIAGMLPQTDAGNQRAMLQAVNDFAGELSRSAGLRVSVLRMPLDVESAKTLRGGGEIDAVAPEAPRFSLRASYALSTVTQP